MTKPQVVLIEDDEILGTSLVQRLRLEGFSVRWARSEREARAILSKGNPDVIVSDIRLPDGDGETIMRNHFGDMGLVPIIFMTAYGEVDQAVRLVRDGAWDYLSKPFDLDALVERLAPIVSQAKNSSAPQSFIYNSAAMKSVMEILTKAANLDFPVTLMGETGTGKEIAARYLHEKAERRSKPFVAVNAGLLQPEMADSLLFGHERGAFTGAHAAHIGFVEEAGEGTLFLDEIGELSLPMQVKLLRLIEERSFRKLGGRAEQEFRARIVCATNRDLEEMISQGGFRQDLWFRINVVTCALPPLRDRREDIAPLLHARARATIARFGGLPRSFTQEALAAAEAYHWPGNIRELFNRTDRAIAMANGTSLDVKDLFPDLNREHASRDVQPVTLNEARDEAEKRHIVSALEKHSGSIQDTAKALDISRTTLWEKMKRYRIR